MSTIVWEGNICTNLTKRIDIALEASLRADLECCPACGVFHVKGMTCGCRAPDEAKLLSSPVTVASK